MARPTKPLEAQELIIARYLAGESTPSICKSEKIAFYTLQKWLLARGHEPRKMTAPKTPPHRMYTLNENAFDVRSEACEYWLGFIATDGCVVKEGTSWKLHVAITETDKPHLEKLNEFLGSNRPIYVTANGKYKPMANLVVQNKRIGETLISYGITPRKSFTIKINRLENSLPFWRGVIDGNGYIGLLQGKYAQLELCGSLPLMEQFSTCFGGAIKPMRSIYRVRFNGDSAVRILTNLYGTSTVHLARKFQSVCDVMLKTFPDSQAWAAARLSGRVETKLPSRKPLRA